jgi:hypothetical protein
LPGESDKVGRLPWSDIPSAPPGMTIAHQKLTAVDLSSEIEFAA